MRLAAIFAISFACIATPAAAVAGPSLAKAPLMAQVDRLTQLLRDSSAVGYPEATMAQAVDLRADRQLVLAVFTVEGFGRGNNHSQYLAAFETDADKSPPYYTLLDVIRIAGKGWRGIDKLNAKVTQSKGGDIAIAVDALEVGPEDAPNFPSKKTVIRVLLKNGRLAEQSQRR